MSLSDLTWSDSGRPSWHDTWLALAWQMGQRSRCARRKVGAVVVTYDLRVNSTGYNGPPPGYEVSGPCGFWCPRAESAGPLAPDYTDCPANHAEANAIARADYTEIHSGILYVSSAMCFTCAKLVASSGIAVVVHAVDEERDGHRLPDAVEDFLRHCDVMPIRARYDTPDAPPRVVVERTNEGEADE